MYIQTLTLFVRLGQGIELRSTDYKADALTTWPCAGYKHR